MFNKNNIIQAAFDKYLGIILETRLSFEKHLETMLCKINKTIGLIRKLQNLLPKTAPITLYKAFVCTHLDYDDIVYDQALIEKKKACKAWLHQKLVFFQYNACFAINGAICGSSREKLCQELGFESLQQRRWYRKLYCF